MADHVFGFIIVLAHKLHWMWDDQKAKQWRMYDYGWKQLDLEGTTLGILAFGNIGRAVAKRAQGFSMKVYAVDKFPRPSEYAEEVWGLDKLDDLLAISEWLVVTAPITDETRGMIGKEQLQKMKPGSHMIVISRGGIVDEFALGQAIESGHLAGAGVDAFDPEPPRARQPVVGQPKRGHVAPRLGLHGRPLHRTPQRLQGELPPVPGRRTVPLRLRQEAGLLAGRH